MPDGKIALAAIAAPTGKKNLPVAGEVFYRPEIAISGKTQADVKLELFHGKWNGSVDPVFREYAY